MFLFAKFGNLRFKDSHLSSTLEILIHMFYKYCLSSTSLFSPDALLLITCSHQFPGAAITKDHKPCALKQQEFILSQFWRPELRSDGSSRACSLWSFWGRLLPHLSQRLAFVGNPRLALVCTHITPVSSSDNLGLSPGALRLCPLTWPFYETPAMGWEPTLISRDAS